DARADGQVVETLGDAPRSRRGMPRSLRFGQARDQLARIALVGGKRLIERLQIRRQYRGHPTTLTHIDEIALRGAAVRPIMTHAIPLVSAAAVAALAGSPLVRAQQPPPQGAPAQAPVRPAPLKSPEIHPDRTVTFRLLAPKATEVTLNGSWDGGTNLTMTKDD